MAISTPEQTLTFQREINAPISEIYRAFTHRDGFNDWLSDGSNVNAIVGGHLLLYWSDNNYVVGEYKTLEENSKIVFTWRGNNEQDDSLVTIMLSDDDGVSLTLKHENLTEDIPHDIYSEQWNSALDNLKSIMETGADKRLTDRIIIGIIPGAVSKEQAANTGLEEGIYAVVTNLVDGYSAEAAGIKTGDIITHVSGRQITPDISLFGIIQEQKLKPGDVVDVTYFRDGQSNTVPITLKGYPIPEMPDNFQQLADRIKEKYDGFKSTIADLFDGTSDEKALARTESGDWSAVENLAHLILTERWLQNWVGGLLQGPEISGFTANAPARIASLTAIYPTKQAMIDAMYRAWDETEALIRAIGEDHLERKNNLWWTTFELHQYDWHTQQHFDQIKNLLS